jgi:hypothetical protein
MARRTKGRRIARWKLDIDGVEYAVNVTLEGTMIGARCAELDVGVSGTDIEQVKADVETAIRKGASLVWDNFIWVTCDGHGTADRTSAHSLGVTFQLVQIADVTGEKVDPRAWAKEHAGDSAMLVVGAQQRYRWRRVTPDGTPLPVPSWGEAKEQYVERGLPRLVADYPSDTHVYALIPDTLAARRGLTAIIEAMQSLEARLKAILGGDNAQRLLTAIASGAPLLEGGTS